jgi:hypothetical protein
MDGEGPPSLQRGERSPWAERVDFNHLKEQYRRMKSSYEVRLATHDRRTAPEVRPGDSDGFGRIRTADSDGRSSVQDSEGETWDGSASGGFGGGSSSGGFREGSVLGGFREGSVSGGFGGGSSVVGFREASSSGGFREGSVSGGFREGSGGVSREGLSRESSLGGFREGAPGRFRGGRGGSSREWSPEGVKTRSREVSSGGFREGFSEGYNSALRGVMEGSAGGFPKSSGDGWPRFERTTSSQGLHSQSQLHRQVSGASSLGGSSCGSESMGTDYSRLQRMSSDMDRDAGLSAFKGFDKDFAWPPPSRAPGNTPFPANVPVPGNAPEIQRGESFERSIPEGDQVSGGGQPFHFMRWEPGQSRGGGQLSRQGSSTLGSETEDEFHSVEEGDGTWRLEVGAVSNDDAGGSFADVLERDSKTNDSGAFGSAILDREPGEGGYDQVQGLLRKSSSDRSSGSEPDAVESGGADQGGEVRKESPTGGDSPTGPIHSKESGRADEGGEVRKESPTGGDSPTRPIESNQAARNSEVEAVVNTSEVRAPLSEDQSQAPGGGLPPVGRGPKKSDALAATRRTPAVPTILEISSLDVGALRKDPLLEREGKPGAAHLTAGFGSWDLVTSKPADSLSTSKPADSLSAARLEKAPAEGRKAEAGAEFAGSSREAAVVGESGGVGGGTGKRLAVGEVEKEAASADRADVLGMVDRSALADEVRKAGPMASNEQITAGPGSSELQYTDQVMGHEAESRNAANRLFLEGQAEADSKQTMEGQSAADAKQTPLEVAGASSDESAVQAPSRPAPLDLRLVEAAADKGTLGPVPRTGTGAGTQGAALVETGSPGHNISPRRMKGSGPSEAKQFGNGDGGPVELRPGEGSQVHEGAPGLGVKEDGNSAASSPRGNSEVLGTLDWNVPWDEVTVVSTGFISKGRLVRLLMVIPGLESQVLDRAAGLISADRCAFYHPI